MTRVNVIALAATMAAVAAVTAPAKAAEWPWCADMFEGGPGGGTATNCGFISWEQCQTYISGMNGWCRPNPFYREERPRRRGERPAR